ncbi:hypothetical protein OG293_09455 [Streptomyces sp. NBC_00829]|nr:hypothetical protein OG293_09455 [Streptomyces sp. NBC_00829]
MRRMNPTETEETTGATESTELTEKDTKAAAGSAERGAGTTDAAAAADAAEADGAGSNDAEDADARDTDGAEAGPRATGLGSAAAGVVAAGLGVVALSGTWAGRVAAERQTLIGQIKTAQGGTPAQQIAAVYGNAWHTTALVNGVFALLALIVGVTVLALPQKAGWVRAFAVAGVVLGVLGVIVSAGMYFDLFLGMPTAGSGS